MTKSLAIASVRVTLGDRTYLISICNGAVTRIRQRRVLTAGVVDYRVVKPGSAEASDVLAAA